MLNKQILKHPKMQYFEGTSYLDLPSQKEALRLILREFLGFSIGSTFETVQPTIPF